MTEIKPTLKIAQQISRRHTLISLKIMIPLCIFIPLFAVAILKLIGVEHPGMALRFFYEQHQTAIVSIMLFIHLVPVNYYAIIRVFKTDFKNFSLKIVDIREKSKATISHESNSCYLMTNHKPVKMEHHD
jgi:hypothetical protein